MDQVKQLTARKRGYSLMNYIYDRKYMDAEHTGEQPNQFDDRCVGRNVNIDTQHSCQLSQQLLLFISIRNSPGRILLSIDRWQLLGTLTAGGDDDNTVQRSVSTISTTRGQEAAADFVITIRNK